MNMAFTITGMLLQGYTAEETVAAILSNPLFLNISPAEVAARVADVVSGLSLTQEAFMVINLLS